MKPTNSKNPACNPISSQCVIWQGDDIPCLKICKGDSIDVVTFKLATEVCCLIDLFNLTNYDLTCLNQCKKPKNIQELIQILIVKICALENITPETEEENGCPDCVVNIAPCFYFNNPQGDQVTTMQLIDYVTAIGNKFCELVIEIENLQEAIENLDERVTTLETNAENAQREGLQLPTLTPVCVLPSTPTAIDQILSALEQQFCELRSATGLPNDLFKAIMAQCTNLINQKTLGPSGGVMGTIVGWINTPKNSADTINNIWLTLCDLRSAVENIQQNCCPNACSDVEISVQATLTGNILKLFFNGVIPAGFVECNVLGTLIKIQDSNGQYITQTITIAAVLNSASGVSIDLTGSPLNLALDFTISGTLCLNNSEISAQCNTLISYILVNTLTCPSPVTITSPTRTSIYYSFNIISGTVGLLVELFDATGTTLIGSQTQIATGPIAVDGTFTGLMSSTVYKLRITQTAGTKSIVCPFETATTSSADCDPPTDVVASFTYGEGVVIPGDFSVLAGSGITNVGTSSTDGDVGTYPTTTQTGFGSFTITGTNHVGDATTQAAKTALSNALTDLSLRTAVTIPTELGGTTVTPGVYDSAAGTFGITGTVILDAQGDPNAVFIFKAASTLITATSSIVQLTNGAQAKNVFWAVGSSATLGSSSIFKGSILALTSITIRTGADIEGRALARNGAVTLDTNIITLP